MVPNVSVAEALLILVFTWIVGLAELLVLLVRPVT